MSSQASKSTSTIRYQPDEKPPYLIALGLALQYSILALGGIVLTVAIVIRSAGSSEAYLAWGAFAALLVSGIATIRRLVHAAEETLLLLIGQTDDDEARPKRRLRLTARTDSGGAELEFLAAGGEGNIEDHMAVISAHAAEAPEEHEFSLRLLRHLATSVQHHKYEDTDIVTVRVDP